ncbi:MAG TPA: gliding motility-associated C-terminal domain-containing protein, partial [Saprospiraceae bacterium]|nr:gliding motility-associated C-terminal domain-containing protein [Saprospiraceae bacterium]
ADGPLPYHVIITSDPGSTFEFDVDSPDFSFQDLPFGTTEYWISDVTTDSPACVRLEDGEQLLEVFPAFTKSDSASVCEGDSLLIGNSYQSAPGIYPVHLSSIHGCDSLVNYTLSLLPAVHVDIQQTTCDYSAIGSFLTFLPNANGCDTLVRTTISLMTTDTMVQNLSTCRFAEAGTFTTTYTNLLGCDSVVLMHLVYTSPTDTTHLQLSSCDSTAWGQSTTWWLDTNGCDSLVVTTIVPGAPLMDSVYRTSCDSSALGVFQNHYLSAGHCDSLVVTTVTYALGDTTRLQETTCDPFLAGQFITLWTSIEGCDSVAILTVSLLASDEIWTDQTTCDSSLAGVFDHHYINRFGCDSLVHQTISLLPHDEIDLSFTTCDPDLAGTMILNLTNQYGCDSTVVMTTTFVMADTTSVDLFTCDPDSVGTITKSYTNMHGCDSLVMIHTAVFLLPEVVLKSISTADGFDISCYGGDDGAAHAITTGIEPFQIRWSTGETDASIQDLTAGGYSVTVTDGNGCTAQSDLVLTQPDTFFISAEISQPDCFFQSQGVIQLEPHGGIGPWQFALNDGPKTGEELFTGLTSGAYQIMAFDAHDCEVIAWVIINSVPNVNVQLDGDAVILAGQSTTLTATVNVPIDSLANVSWTGLDSPECDKCLTQAITPVITTLYTISVINTQGCRDADSLTVTVIRPDDIYIPNVFSPNGDQINDLWMIRAGQRLEEVESLVIFDRWGNLVYKASHFYPDDPSFGWDGRWNEKPLPPGVYAYRLVLAPEDISGLHLPSRVHAGDITLIR